MTGRMSVCVVLYERFTHGLLALISACFDLILGGTQAEGGKSQSAPHCMQPSAILPNMCAIFEQFQPPSSTVAG